jgi:hypothetical protein
MHNRGVDKQLKGDLSSVGATRSPLSKTSGGLDDL